MMTWRADREMSCFLRMCRQIERSLPIALVPLARAPIDPMDIILILRVAPVANNRAWNGL